MNIRIKPNAYVHASGEPLRTFLKENENSWFEVETNYLFDNQYNIGDFRIFDSMINAVLDDVRNGLGKCNYCGKIISPENVTCLNKPECLNYGVEWFTEKNSFFLKYPNGLPQPGAGVLTYSDNTRVGSYSLENYPGLDYFRLRNNRQCINFKFDGEFYYIMNGIGYTQQRSLPIPISQRQKLKNILTEAINNNQVTL